MKKILFPFDFSTASINAFKYALNLAERLEAAITTLHVYQMPLAANEKYYGQLLENYCLEIWAQLDDYEPKVPVLRKLIEEGGFSGISISHLLEQGDASKVIAQVAIREKIDLIVMGTTGATGLSEIFLGSVAEKVINEAPCNVMAIPVLAEYSPIKKILYMAEFPDFRYRQLDKVYEFAHLFDAHIDVLQINSEHHANEERILELWEKHFSGKDIQFHIHVGSDPESMVMDFIKKHKTSAVAIHTHHKSLLRRIFLYSLSQQLTFHSKVPVLGLREKYAG